MEEKNKKRVLNVFLFVLLIVIIFFISKSHITGKSITAQNIEIVPLSSEDRAKVIGVLSTSGFISDIPRKGVIGLRFFSFSSGKQIWHDGFLIGKDKLLSSGEPDIYLSLHSKYIPEFNGDLCEVIQRANANRDLGFYSESNKAWLLIKYAGMLKHRKCFGF